MSAPYDGLPPPPPGQQPWSPASAAYYEPPGPPAPAATGPVEYHQILRTGRWGANGWWRPPVGLIALVLAFFVGQTALTVPFLVYLTSDGTSVSDALDDLASTADIHPYHLAYINLGWAVAIPARMLVLWIMHRLKPGWLVRRSPRGCGGAGCSPASGLAFVALFATVVVSALLPSTGDAPTWAVDLNAWTTTTRDFALVIAAAHAAAGGGGGVRLPRLPHPGLRRSVRAARSPGLAGGRRAAPGRCCSPSRTAPRTRRSSSTGSRSGWSPGSW